MIFFKICVNVGNNLDILSKWNQVFLEKEVNMRGMVMRKRLVYGRIAQLPPDERERAQKLYLILDKIEWLSFAPLYLTAGVPILWMFIVLMIFGSSSMGFASDARNIHLLWVLVGGALFCAAGVLIVSKIVFKKHRDKEMDKLREMISSDYTCIDMLDTLKQLDPDMAHTIGWYIAQAIYN